MLSRRFIEAHTIIADILISEFIINEELETIDLWLFTYRTTYPHLDLSPVYGYVAKCLAEKGYIAEVRRFFVRYFPESPMMQRALLKGMIEGLISGGNKAGAYYILEEVQYSFSGTRKVLESMIEGFVISNRMAEAYELFEYVEKNCPDHLLYVMREIVSEEKLTTNRITPETEAFVLEKLTTIKDRKIRNDIVIELRPFLDTPRLIRQADKRSHLMVDHAISYNQLKGWINPVIQMLVLEGFGVNPISNKSKDWRLPLDIIDHIAAFLLLMKPEEALDLTEKFRYQMNKLSIGRFFHSNSQDESKAFFTNALKANGLLEEQKSPLPHSGVIDILLEAQKPRTIESPALKKAFFVEEQGALAEWKASKAHKKQQTRSQETITNPDYQGVVNVLLAAPEPKKKGFFAFKRNK